MSSNSTSSGGIGLLGALTLIFIVLKLTEVGVVAQWTWFWVLSPTLIPWMIIIGLAAIYFGIWKPVAWLADAIHEWSVRRENLRRQMDSE
jgi:fatty acid desaturase